MFPDALGARGQQPSIGKTFFKKLFFEDFWSKIFIFHDFEALRPLISHVSEASDTTSHETASCKIIKNKVSRHAERAGTAAINRGNIFEKSWFSRFWRLQASNQSIFIEILTVYHSHDAGLKAWSHGRPMAPIDVCLESTCPTLQHTF